VQKTATINPTIGKNARISGTGTTPTLAAGTADKAAEPLASEANWIVGTDTNSSLKAVLAMASSSSVAGRDGALDATRKDDSLNLLGADE